MILREAEARQAWRWGPFFLPQEFVCKGSGILQIDEDFMDELVHLRAQFMKPMPVSSGYRSPEYNAKVSTTGLTGPHTKAAVDIRIYGTAAFELVQLALARGWKGVGVNQRGAVAGRFVHLDSPPGAVMLEPRPRIWSY